MLCFFKYTVVKLLNAPLLLRMIVNFEEEVFIFSTIALIQNGSHHAPIEDGRWLPRLVKEAKEDFMIKLNSRDYLALFS